MGVSDAFPLYFYRAPNIHSCHLTFRGKNLPSSVPLCSSLRYRKSVHYPPPRSLANLAHRKAKKTWIQITRRTTHTPAPIPTEHREGIRLDMMRSIVTEPLLSKVNPPSMSTKIPRPEIRRDHFLERTLPRRRSRRHALGRAARQRIERHLPTNSRPTSLSVSPPKKSSPSPTKRATSPPELGPSGSVVYRIWEDQAIVHHSHAIGLNSESRRRPARVSSPRRRHRVGRARFRHPRRPPSLRR